jgi:hypothetical protein
MQSQDDYVNLMRNTCFLVYLTLSINRKDDDNHHSHRRGNLKSYNRKDGYELWLDNDVEASSQDVFQGITSAFS